MRLGYPYLSCDEGKKLGSDIPGLTKVSRHNFLDKTILIVNVKCASMRLPRNNIRVTLNLCVIQYLMEDHWESCTASTSDFFVHELFRRSLLCCELCSIFSMIMVVMPNNTAMMPMIILVRVFLFPMMILTTTTPAFAGPSMTVVVAVPVCINFEVHVNDVTWGHAPFLRIVVFGRLLYTLDIGLWVAACSLATCRGQQRGERNFSGSFLDCPNELRKISSTRPFSILDIYISWASAHVFNRVVRGFARYLGG